MPIDKEEGIGIMIKKILSYFDRKRQEEREHQIRLLQVLVDQQSMAHENSLKMFERLTQEVLSVTKAQNDVFKAWMDSFKVVDLPKTTTMRDEDELRMERERLKAQGYPIDSSLEDQVSWLLKDLEHGE